MPPNQAMIGKMSKAEEAELGLPEGFASWSPWPFGGMNQEADRAAMADPEVWWRENYLRIGDGYLRTIWDRGEALYIAPSGLTIVSFAWYSINQTQYVAVFLSDGSGVQVQQSNGAVTTISGSGTFYNGNLLPACCQWGTTYLLIASNISQNAYWVWDGSLLYTAGTVSPVVDIISGGSNYSTAPVVTAFGGSGTILSPTSIVNNGSVVQIEFTSAGSGYEPGDIVQLSFSGGGSDSSAVLTASLVSGVVSFIEVTKPGGGYSSPPTINITGGGGSGATATAVISASGLYAVNLTSGGSGYVGTPTVAFSGGSGSGATAIAFLGAGRVSAINIINGGTNYISTPTISFVGGGGTGATGTVTLTSGVITSGTVTSGGSGYTSAPAVIIAPGSNNAAAAQLELMPFGISGSAIETFLNRVWLVAPYSATNLANSGTILISAPQSLSDFATSDGGLIYVSNEPFLRTMYVNIKQSNGYLYPFGDTAVDVISNVQTGGSPTTTTFSYQNVDPQTSVDWRDTAQYFGLSVLFANQTGAFGLYGGAVKKISKKVTQLFQSAVFPASGGVTPSSAVASIYTIKCYVINMTIVDPTTGQTRTMMLGWDENEWFPISQSSTLTYIGTQTQSSAYTAWGTDGKSLFPLFQTPGSIPKKLSTKLYGANSFPVFKQGLGFWMMAQDKAGTGITMNVQMDTEYQSTVLPTSPLSFNGQPQIGTDTEGVIGSTIGATITSTSQDYVVRHLVMGYSNIWGGFGSPPEGLVDAISGGTE